MHTTIQPKNKKSTRPDRRLGANQPKDKWCVLVIRQKIQKTRTFVIKSENEDSILNLVRENVHPSATIYTDEHSAYNILHSHYDIKRVNHSR